MLSKNLTSRNLTIWYSKIYLFSKYNSTTVQSRAQPPLTVFVTSQNYDPPKLTLHSNIYGIKSENVYFISPWSYNLSSKNKLVVYNRDTPTYRELFSLNSTQNGRLCYQISTDILSLVISWRLRVTTLSVHLLPILAPKWIDCLDRCIWLKTITFSRFRYNSDARI